jgi:hypothetical protein
MAAVCKTSKNMEILLKAKYEFVISTNVKVKYFAENCPLANAIKLNNADNVKFLLDNNEEHFLNLKYEDL